MSAMTIQPAPYSHLSLTPRGGDQKVSLDQRPDTAAITLEKEYRHEAADKKPFQPESAQKEGDGTKPAQDLKEQKPIEKEIYLVYRHEDDKFVRESEDPLTGERVQYPAKHVAQTYDSVQATILPTEKSLPL